MNVFLSANAVHFYEKRILTDCLMKCYNICILLSDACIGWIFLVLILSLKLSVNKGA